VGVIAVMEERFPEEVSKEYVQDLDVLPIIPTLRSYMPDLDKQTDLIIVLVHADFPDAEKIAWEVPGIDIALVASNEGGFAEVNGVLVKSTFGRQKTIGKLRLEVKNDRIVSYEEDLIWLWADIDLQPSPEVSELVEEVEGQIKKEFFRVIGKSDMDYLCKNYDSIENALGNWITDVLRWKTGAQVAMQNSGGIRADIKAGPISRRDIFALSPFRNTLVKFKMTGQQIKNAMEVDIERGRDRLQISGMHYTYYPKNTKPMGERVDYLVVNGDVVVKQGKVLLPDAVYTVVSNDYVVGQAKDKYFGFTLKNPIDTEIALSLVLIEWLEKNKALTCSVQSRIVELK
jgi:2',3'-cyclic-nucleotide 2'-phosphodiesterase (5'-nucleotidase family)